MNIKRFTVNLTLILTMLLGIGAVHTYANTLNVPGTYLTIQAAIDAAAPGDTIQVAPGTYTENIVINKRIILQGASPTTTIITSVSPGVSVVTITAGGTDASNRLVLQNLRITGANGGDNSTGSGIYYATGPLGFTTFDNIVADYNSGNGISIESQNPLDDILIQNSSLLHNGNSGIRAAAICPSINALKILDSHLDFNSAGLTVYSHVVTNWEIRNSTFNDNVGPPGIAYSGGYGIGFDGIDNLNNITIACSEFSRNKGNADGNDISTGIYILSVEKPSVNVSYSNVTISNSLFDSNALNGILLQPGDNTAMDAISITCNIIKNSGDTGILLSFLGTPTNISIHHSNFLNNAYAGLDNQNASTIDAKNNWWGSDTGPSGIGPGTGDAIFSSVTGAVLFDPFRTSASACPTACTPAPAISIVKKTNGTDNDTAPGVIVEIGSTVTWTYLVTNTGNVPLTNVIVTDDRGVTVSCPATTLGDGESMTCTASSIAVAGQYTNIGSVTGTPPTGPDVTASNPDNYFGSAPAISILKKTNGTNNDVAPGPIVPMGSTVTWTYLVTNTGNVSLTNIAVTDNQIGAITCPASTLAAGASMTCTATGTAVAGQYTNIGSVTGKPPVGSNVTASNPDNYFGQAPPLVLTCPANAGTVGVPYSSAVTPSGGVPGYTFMIASGSLPPGLSLNPATGAITGTPTTAGSFIFTVKVTDSKGTTAFSSCGAACAGGGVTWNFNTPSGVLSTAQTYTVNGIPIKAYGFTNAGAPRALYGKNDGGIENGLGIAGTSADNEIDLNTFVQLDLSNLITSGATNAKMVVNSVQAGEKYNVYGSNTLGSIGTLLGASNRTLGNTPFLIPGFPTYRYLSVRASYADVLLSSVSFTLPTGCIITIAPPPQPVCGVAGTLTFSGNSATSGAAGNLRTFSLNGVNVHVSAFSRTRSSGTWNSAYLGVYSGGLGVTDTSEGDGSSDRHKVDNIGGRDNYVVLEFSKSVVLDRAFLDVVGADSDVSVWIGTKTDPYNNHQTLSNALLSGFYTEDNSTADTTPGSRWADLNVTQKSGNIVVIAALTTDLSPEDAFKISKLEIGCPPPPVCSAGTFAFTGNTATSGTAGNIRTFAVNGVTVKASAFSRTDSGGSWAPAYLGLYSAGFGVTDSSEGDGSNDRHKVDNIGGRNNYVLFEFSAPVVVDRAYLDFVGADSDLSAWIGMKDDPINNHLTLSDALLSSLGAREDNPTTSTTSRWANINSGNLAGNVLVISGKAGDATLNDAFKLSKLEITCR